MLDCPRLVARINHVLSLQWKCWGTRGPRLEYEVEDERDNEMICLIPSRGDYALELQRTHELRRDFNMPYLVWNDRKHDRRRRCPLYISFVNVAQDESGSWNGITGDERDISYFAIIARHWTSMLWFAEDGNSLDPPLHSNIRMQDRVEDCTSPALLEVRRGDHHIQEKPLRCAHRRNLAWQSKLLIFSAVYFIM